MNAKKVLCGLLAAAILTAPLAPYAKAEQGAKIIPPRFGAEVQVDGVPATNAVLVFNPDGKGVWKASTGGVPTSSTWAVVLANGNTTGGTNPSVSAGDLIIFANSSGATVSAASTGRIIYNSGTQTFQVSQNGGAYASLVSGPVSLQVAYNGGATIATTGSTPVAISSTAADNASILTVVKNPAGAQSGSIFSVTGGATTTGTLIFANQTTGGSGALMQLQNNATNRLLVSSAGSVTVTASGTNTGINVNVASNSANPIVIRDASSNVVTVLSVGGLLVTSSATSTWAVSPTLTETGVVGFSNAFQWSPTQQDLGAADSNTHRTLYLTPTYNFTNSTGHFEALTVDPTITSAPSGTNYLATFRTNGGSPLVSIDTSGNVAIAGKLTVTGAIDPPSVSLSGGTALFFDSANGSTAAVSGANHGRIRYLDGTGWQVSSNTGAYATLTTGAATLSLQNAYAGGATIAETGGTAVALSSTTADNGSVLTVSKNPGGAQSGSIFSVTGGATTTGSLIFANQTTGGSGLLLQLQNNATNAMTVSNGSVITLGTGATVTAASTLILSTTAAASININASGATTLSSGGAVATFAISGFSHKHGSDAADGFCSTSNTNSSSLDVALSRSSPGVMALGTGAVGSAAGTLLLTTLEAPIATALTLGANQTAYWSIGTTGLLTAGTGIASGGVQIKGPSDAGFQIESGTNQIFYFGTHEAQDVNIFTNNLSRWKVNPTGGLVGITNGAAHITWTNDNASDIGASGATRPRTGYFGTSVVTATLNAPAATTLNLGGGGASQWTIGADGTATQTVSGAGNGSYYLDFIGGSTAARAFFEQFPLINGDGFRQQLCVSDRTALAAGVGGGITLYGDCGTTNAQLVELSAYKENATSNDRASSFVLKCNNANGSNNGLKTLAVSSAAVIKTISTGVYGGTSSATDPTGAADWGMSRGGAATIDFGNGTAGNKTGILEFTTASMVGKVGTYNGVTTAGWGVPAIYGTGRGTAQTGAVASVAAYTCGAADGSFLISANVNVTTSSAENFTVTCAYTDETNAARAETLTFTSLAGAALTAINFANGASPYSGVAVRIRCKASTAITIATTGTFTGATYNVEADITQVK